MCVCVWGGGGGGGGGGRIQTHCLGYSREDFIWNVFTGHATFSSQIEDTCMQFECPKLLEYVHAANEELPEHLIIRSYLAAFSLIIMAHAHKTYIHFIDGLHGTCINYIIIYILVPICRPSPSS